MTQIYIVEIIFKPQTNVPLYSIQQFFKDQKNGSV